MLSTRFCDFRKFDKGGNNLLAFEEWTAARADRFGSSDANHDAWLWQAEFAHRAQPQAEGEMQLHEVAQAGMRSSSDNHRPKSTFARSV